MSWGEDDLGPEESYVYRGELVIVGKFDCKEGHPGFAVTESVHNDVFVLATRPLWFRRNTPRFQYIGPGGILLHPSGCTIERRGNRSSRDLSYWFAIRPDVFREIVGTHRIGSSLPTETLFASPKVQFETRLLLRRLREGTATALDVESRVIALLDSICRTSGVSNESRMTSSARPHTRERTQRQVEAAMSFVDTHLSENIEIGRVASEVGVSPFHLCRQFKAINGITLHEYRTRQRLAFVIDDLLDRARSDLTDLALDAGFSSHSHLTRLFKNRLGITPSVARGLA